jgi:hypothetical protein
MWKVLLLTNLQRTIGSNQVDNNKMVANHMVHWKHGHTVYGQCFNLWFFWSKVAFQWTWNFHTTLDVEDNVTHYLQHIFTVFHFYVEINSYIQILEKNINFHKIWDPMVAKFKCWSWGI